MYPQYVMGWPREFGCRKFVLVVFRGKKARGLQDPGPLKTESSVHDLIDGAGADHPAVVLDVHRDRPGTGVREIHVRGGSARAIYDRPRGRGISHAGDSHVPGAGSGNLRVSIDP